MIHVKICSEAEVTRRAVCCVSVGFPVKGIKWFLMWGVCCFLCRMLWGVNIWIWVLWGMLLIIWGFYCWGSMLALMHRHNIGYSPLLINWLCLERYCWQPNECFFYCASLKRKKKKTWLWNLNEVLLLDIIMADNEKKYIEFRLLLTLCTGKHSLKFYGTVFLFPETFVLLSWMTKIIICFEVGKITS